MRNYWFSAALVAVVLVAMVLVAMPTTLPDNEALRCYTQMKTSQMKTYLHSSILTLVHSSCLTNFALILPDLSALLTCDLFALLSCMTASVPSPELCRRG